MVSCANRKALFDDSLHLGLEMNVFFQFRAPMITLSMLKVIVLVGLHLYAISFCPITTLNNENTYNRRKRRESGAIFPPYDEVILCYFSAKFEI